MPDAAVAARPSHAHCSGSVESEANVLCRMITRAHKCNLVSAWHLCVVLEGCCAPTWYGAWTQDWSLFFITEATTGQAQGSGHPGLSSQ